MPAEQRGFGMVFQNYALFPHMTVFGNVAFGLELQRRPAAEVKERVRAMLQLVRLPEFEDRYPSQLSGGQQQRVAIARALVLHPRLLLLDEPLSNLDAKLRVEMRAEIKRIHASLGLTCVYVTHDQIEALSLSDWVVVMRDGIVMQAGPPNEIYNRPAQCVRRRLHGVPEFLSRRNPPRWAACSAAMPRSVSRDNTLKPGQPATAAIRPEDVEIGGNGAGTNQFRGRVEIVEYLGRDNEAVLRLEDQSPLWVHTKAHLAPGDVVSVTFPPDKVILLPDAPGARRMRTRERRELDLTAILCLLPSVIFVVGMFVYPFLRGVYLSVRPAKEPGLSLANYIAFFSDEWQYGTIWITFSIAIPTTVLVVLTALFLAYGMRRGIRMERTITTILVLPVSLGVILLSIGIQGFYGSRGWFNQFLVGTGLLSEPLQLTNNKTGVMLSLFMQQFPFCFLMLLGYISGIDPTLEKSARTLGAGPWAVFRRVMLPADGAGHRHRIRAGVRDDVSRCSRRPYCSDSRQAQPARSRLPPIIRRSSTTTCPMRRRSPSSWDCASSPACF